MEQLIKQSIREFKQEIDKCQKPLILCHKNPDGDTLGAGLALYAHLTSKGVDTKIACIDPVSDRLSFVPNADKIQHEINPSEHDFIIAVDSSADYMTGFHIEHPGLWTDYNTANVDHHISNNGYAKINIVPDDIAATCEILTEMFNEYGWKITPTIATCLMTGLYNDTGSFMHPNTTTRNLRLAAQLASKGADIQTITKEMFCTLPISTMKLWGRVMSRASINSENVVVSVAKKEDITECQADDSAISGVIDYLNSVPNTKYSLLLHEKEGAVKGSFRTQRSDIDVQEIAGKYGGGGHKAAAGFTIKGQLQKEVKWKIVE